MAVNEDGVMATGGMHCKVWCIILIWFYLCGPPYNEISCHTCNQTCETWLSCDKKEKPGCHCR